MDDETTQALPVSLDRGAYLDKAIDSLSSKYVLGFWEWMKEEEPTTYEIINHKRERMEHECTSGTNDSFRTATKQWWADVARNLQTYRKIQEVKNN